MKNVIKSFFIAGIIYMFVGVLIGGMISGGKIGDYAKTDDGHWLEAEHVFINNIGFLSFILMGAVYYIVPLISRRDIYSKELAKYGFILLNLGLISMILGNFSKGLSLFAYSSEIIMLGGIILTMGFFIYGYNVLRSL